MLRFPLSLPIGILGIGEGCFWNHLQILLSLELAPSSFLLSSLLLASSPLGPYVYLSPMPDLHCKRVRHSSRKGTAFKSQRKGKYIGRKIKKRLFQKNLRRMGFPIIKSTSNSLCCITTYEHDLGAQSIQVTAFYTCSMRNRKFHVQFLETWDSPKDISYRAKMN